MLTPARKHFLQKTAALAAGDTATGETQTGDQYELMMAALYEARRTLKSIQSIEAKVAKKRELAPQFYPYIAGVLEGGNGAQDEVLMTLMAWLFDIGEISAGLDIAAYALHHGISTPDRFQRDTASLVAEQVAEEALKTLTELEKTEGAEHNYPLLDNLVRTDQLTARADMHDQIRAKLHKALGYANRQCGRTEEAISHLNRALQLNEKVGVKKDIEKLERDLKNQQKSEQT
ncbi:MAG: phage terminase small subunit [Moraxellaceae bacterium]|nr:phage terminase small subunit [Moraxellaceae bacterium]